MKKLLLLIPLYLTLVNSFAQTAGQTNVTIYIKDVYTNINEDPSRDEYRWNIWLNNDLKVNCIQKKGGPGWYNDINAYLTNSASYGSIPNFSLKSESWEEDNCGSECGFNTRTGCGDNARCLQTKTLNLYNYSPGVYNQEELTYCGGSDHSTTIRYRFKYTTPVPADPTVKVDGADYNISAQVCTSSSITLHTSTTINPAFHNAVRYEWEYYIDGDDYDVEVSNPAYCAGSFGGDVAACAAVKCSGIGGSTGACCCYEPATITETRQNWRSLGTTYATTSNGDKMISDISSLAGLTNVSTNTGVKFRVRSIANGSTSYGWVESAHVKLSPKAPTYTGVTSTPSCTGGIEDGTITINGISGSSGSYRYNILLKSVYDNVDCSDPTKSSCISASYATGTTSASSTIIENLPSGIYVVQLGNSGGSYGNCFTETTVTVGEKPVPTLSSAVPTNISCSGADDGKITVTASGGSGTLMYSIDNGGSFQSGNVFTNLSPGTYKVIVKDGCDITKSLSNIKISEPTQVTGSNTPTAANCSNPYNGQVVVTVANGSGTYNYKLTKGSLVYKLTGTTNKSWTVPALASGTYSLDVRDANRTSCAGYTASVVIGNPTPLLLTAGSPTPVTCNNAGDGKINLTGSGGTGSYTYKMHNNTTGENFTSSTGSFTTLTGGSYTASMKNSNSCGDQYTLPGSVTINEPAAISISTSSNPITCYGADDGSLSATVSGGNGGFTYRWEFYDSLNSTWADYNMNGEGTGLSLTNVFPTVYRIIATDSKSCSLTSPSVVMNEPARVRITDVTIVNVPCNGGTGTFYPAISGGTGTYTSEYSTDNAIWQSFTPGDQLPVGTYYLRSKDENDCQAEYGLPIEIKEPEQIALTIFPENNNGFNLKCFQGTDGTVTLEGTGGTPSYEYAIGSEPFQSSNSFTGLQADSSYEFHIRDVNGCSTSQTIILTQPDSLQAAVDAKVQPLCNGDSNGSITASATGGAGTYLYSKDNITYTADPVLSGYSAGDNIYYVQDINGCITKGTFVLDEPTPVEVLVDDTQNLTCFENGTGVIDLQATGGTGGYEFSVDDLAYQEEIEFTGLAAGEHRIYARDAHGCIAEGLVTLSQPDLLQLSVADQNEVKCFGFNTGYVEVAATGGTGAYRYSIDDLNYQAETRFDSLTAQQYTLYVLDDNDCKATVTTTIASLEPVVAELNPLDVSCYNYSNGEITVNVIGGTPPYTYDWQGTDQKTSHVTGLPIGEYSVVVKDDEGCKAVESTSLTQPDNIDLGEPVSICQDQTYPLDATHPRSVKYQWTSSNGYTGDQPVAYLTEAGNYELTLTLDDGCIMHDDFVLEKSDVKFEVNFLGATEAVLGDTVRMIEVCYPAPETVSWDFGQQANVLVKDDHRPQISYDDPGEYWVTLTATYSGCIDSLSKKVIFFKPEDKPDNSGRFALGEVGIKMVELYPNPNNGKFTMMVYLYQQDDLMVMVYDLFGQEVMRRKLTEDARYEVDFNLSGMKNRVYIVKLITSTESRDVRVLIK